MAKRKMHLMLILSLVASSLPTQWALAGDGPTNTIRSLVTSTTNLNAGNAISVSFQVRLGTLPSTPYSYVAYVSAESDENGDPWNPQQWSASAQLVSGTPENGTWSATVSIGSNAYTGNYVIGIAIPDKTFDADPSAPFHIDGTTAPIPLSSLTGSITNIGSTTTELTAGSSYEFTFDVALTSMPISQFVFVGSISAKPDENGDPWTEESWWNKATLISGDMKSGTYKIAFTIPSSAYTGDYVFSAGQGVSKGITGASLAVRIKGVTPSPPITPFYTFSNYTLTQPAVAKGSNASATFRLVTNDPQVQVPECITDGASSGWVNATLVSGNSVDGNWSCRIAIPTDTLPGTYDFHIVVIGYANKNKNEERVILPLKVVAQPSDLYENNAYITTTSVQSSGPISSDSTSGNLAYQPSTTAVARIYIPMGLGNAVVSVSGSGIISSSNSYSSAAKVISITRSTSVGSNIYVFADGTQGRSTISISLSGQQIVKILSFGSAPVPASTPSPTASSSPRSTPSASQSPDIAKASSSPKPSAEKSETPKVLPSASPSPRATSVASPSASGPNMITSDDKVAYSNFVVTAKTALTKYPAIYKLVFELLNSAQSPTGPIKDINVWRSDLKARNIKLTQLVTSQQPVTITCKKGKTTKKVTGVSPKCPKGYVKK